MNTKAIIQARMGSTRLPGKIMMKLNGISILESLLKQISYCTKLDGVILATTVNKEDDVIETFANDNSIDFFRGDSSDVLNRFYQCSKKFQVDNIVRITSDCPLLDPQLVDKVISLFFTKKYDYTNNFFKRTFPYGTEVEVFSFDSLEKTWKNAKLISQREHVTPYIYDNQNLFSIGYIENDVDISYLHWAVDRIEDLKFVRKIYQKIKKHPILLNDILRVLSKNPSFLNLNKDINPREGYEKSLLDDIEK